MVPAEQPAISSSTEQRDSSLGNRERLRGLEPRAHRATKTNSSGVSFAASIRLEFLRKTLLGRVAGRILVNRFTLATELPQESEHDLQRAHLIELAVPCECGAPRRGPPIGRYGAAFGPKMQVPPLRVAEVGMTEDEAGASAIPG